jgi:catechol 2,3-dioxygenase-like lactoylglutathione lyase family enzyme
MDLSLSHCFVTVHDPDLALAFYRDALGLEVRNDVSAEGFRWVTLSPPSQPDIEIVLVEPHAGHSTADGDALLGLLTKGSLNGVIFRTDDLDDTFEKVRAGGAEVLQEPIHQPYGVRDCAFRDPSGNMVRISQAADA